MNKKEEVLAESIDEALAHLNDLADLLTMMGDASKEELADYREDMTILISDALPMVEDVVTKLKALE